MKLLWDAVGTEFAGRHELYERNYAGNHEDIRIQTLTAARRSGSLDAMLALVDRCMAEYDEKGWVDSAWSEGLPGPREAAAASPAVAAGS
jgi:4-hydroxyphenylacetate 3-monooxygenase